jgi:hypothetical protein
MKRLLVASILVGHAFAAKEKPNDVPPLLVLDAKNTAVLPEKFRALTSSYRQDRIAEFEQCGKPIPSRKGLGRDLTVLGSGQFSLKQLEKVRHYFKGPLYVVDLREETHGFINGAAVSWFGHGNRANVGKDLWAIMHGEEGLLSRLKHFNDVVIHVIKEKLAGGLIRKTLAYNEPISAMTSEAKLVQSMGGVYKRFPVTDRVAPSMEVMHQFIAYMKSLPQDAILYIHCRAGSGRTTTFMALVDIWLNGQDLSFEEIMNRQYLLGGKDFLRDPPYPHLKEHTSQYLQRRTMLKSFYQQITGKAV